MQHAEIQLAVWPGECQYLADTQATDQEEQPKMTYLSDMQRNRLIDALAAGTEASLSEVGGDDAGYWGCKVAVKIKVSEQQGGSIIREHAFGPIYIPQPDEGADRRKEAREQYEGLYNEIAQIVVMHQAGTPFFGTPRVTQLAEPWS